MKIERLFIEHEPQLVTETFYPVSTLNNGKHWIEEGRFGDCVEDAIAAGTRVLVSAMLSEETEITHVRVIDHATNMIYWWGELKTSTTGDRIYIEHPQTDNPIHLKAWDTHFAPKPAQWVVQKWTPYGWVDHAYSGDLAYNAISKAKSMARKTIDNLWVRCVCNGKVYFHARVVNEECYEHLFQKPVTIEVFQEINRFPAFTVSQYQVGDAVNIKSDDPWIEGFDAAVVRARAKTKDEDAVYGIWNSDLKVVALFYQGDIYRKMDYDGC